MWKLFAAAALVTVAVLYISKRNVSIKCGNGVSKENMTAGLGTINGLSFYNQSSNCHPGNAMGSSSPFCSTNGYVLT